MLRTILAGVLAIAAGLLFVAPPPAIAGKGIGGVRSYALATPSPTPTAPIVTLPMYAYGDSSGAPCAVDGTDPGATPDKYVVAYQETCSLSLASSLAAANCAGPTNGVRCYALVYADLSLNYCTTGELGGAPLFTWAIANDEGAFWHVRNGLTFQGVAGNGTITAANRLYWSGLTKSKCGNIGGVTDAAYMMNPGDASMLAWEATNIWSTSTGVLTANLGVFRDDTPHNGGKADDVNASCEYGGGYWYQVSTQVGCTQGIDYEAAVAKDMSNMAPAPVVINMIGQGASIGKSAVTAHGIAGVGGAISPTVYGAGYFQGTPDLYDLCAGLTTSNVVGLTTERNVTSGGAINSPYLTSSAINEGITLASLASTYPNCANAKVVQLNQPTAPANGRSYVMALAGLVTSGDGADDEIVNWQYPTGCVSNCTGSTVEFAYFPEYTFVAYEPLGAQSLVTFAGSTPDALVGCEGFGDTGGAPALVVACPGGSSANTPVYCRQYGAIAINKVSQGAGAYCVNTSTSPVTVSSTWFPYTPNGYNYAVSFTGNEVGASSTGPLASGNIPYTGAPGNVVSMAAGCSDATNCNGTYTWNGIPLCGSPPCNSVYTYQIPAQSGVLLHV